MNAQELFDASALHLLCQNERSIGSVDGLENACRLNNGKGLRCAIGCLIPPEYYTKRLEGSSVLDILAAAGGSNKFADREVRLTSKQVSFFSGWLQHSDLLYDLQATHDAFPIEDWSTRLRSVAVKHGLRFEMSLAHV